MVWPRVCTLRHAGSESRYRLVQQFNIVDFGSTFDGIELPLDPTDSTTTIQSAIDSRGLYVESEE